MVTQSVQFCDSSRRNSLLFSASVWVTSTEWSFRENHLRVNLIALLEKYHNQTQSKAFNYSCLRYIYQALKHDIWLYCLSLKITIYCNFATLQIYCNLSRYEGQKQRGGMAIRHHKLAQKCKMRHTKAPQRETRCFTDNSQVISNHYPFITQFSFASIV